MGSNENAGQNRGLLTGWQAIGEHFGRDQSTVRRWAASRDLPVHRASGEKGVSVYAYAHELDAWLTRIRTAERSEAADAPDKQDTQPGSILPGPASRTRRTLFRVAAVVVALMLAGTGVAIFSPWGGGEAPGSAAPEEARELYLRGTWLWNRRTPEGIAGAIEALTQALDIHPDYPQAHASLAMTYNLARQYSDMSGQEAYPRAEEHARRAVELAPNYAFGQAVLAFVEFHWLWQVEEGLARFEEALRLDPDNSDALMWYASSLILADRSADALPILARAQELDPDNTTILNMKGQALFLDGREEESIALVQQLIDRDPTHPWNYYAMGLVRLGQLDYAGYLENYAKLGDMIGVPRYRAVAEAGLAALGNGDGDGDEEAMAEAMVDVDTEFYERGEALAWDIAGHYAMVGNWREAIPWLRTSLERHEERLIGVKYNLAFRPIRYRPEYRQLLAEIGFPAD